MGTDNGESSDVRYPVTTASVAVADVTTVSSSSNGCPENSSPDGNGSYPIRGLSSHRNFAEKRGIFKSKSQTLVFNIFILNFLPISFNF
jgi:hypothetical protein